MAGENEQLIVDVVGDNPHRQLDTMIEKLELVETRIVQINKVAKEIENSSSSGSSLQKALDAQARVKAIFQESEDAVGAFGKTVREVDAWIAHFNGSSEKAARVALDMNRTQKEAIGIEIELEKRKAATAATREAEAKAIEAEARADRARQAIARKGTQDQLEQYNALKKAYTEAANKAKELGVQEYNRLGLAGLQTEAYKKANAEAKKLYDILFAIESSVGQSQRGVGQYERAGNGLSLAVQNILREAPSAAVSLQTFFLAISNNLPMLFDEMKKIDEAAKKANQTSINSAVAARKEATAKALAAGATAEAAAAEGEYAAMAALAGVEGARAAAIAREEAIARALAMGATEAQAAAAGELAAAQVLANNTAKAGSGVLKALGKSIFSGNTLLTVGVTLLTLYGGEIFKVIKGFFGMKEAIEGLTEAQKAAYELGKQIGENYAKEAIALEVLRARIEDTNVPMKIRMEAIDDIQKQFPTYFGNLEKEAILVGNIGNAYARANESIMARARLSAYSGVAETNAARMVQLEDRIKSVAGKRPGLDIQKAGADAALPGSYSYGDLVTLVGDNPTYKTGETDKDGKTVWSNLVQDINEYNSLLLDNTELLKQIRSLTPLAAVDVTNPKKDKKGKAVPDDAKKELQGLKSLYAAQSELRKQQITQDMEANQEIFQNEQESFEARKLAYENYASDRRYVADAVRDQEIANARAEGATAAKQLADGRKRTAEEIASLEAVKKAARVNEQAAVERHAATLAKIQTESSKYLRELEESEQEKAYQAVVEGLKKIEAQYTTAYAARKARLDASLRAGKLSQQNYNREIARLNNETAGEVYQAQIENLEDLIKLFPAGTEGASKLTDELARLKKELAGMKADRPTVGALGIDEEQMRRLANAFAEARSFAQEFADLQSNLSARRIAELDNEIDKINKARDAEITRIEGSALGEEEKERRIATAKALAAEQERQLEVDKITRQRRNAIFQKAATIAQITLETILAGIKALNDSATVPNFYVRLANAGIAAAFGAVKIAAAASVPLPSYHDGTQGEPHPGGPARLFEGNKLEYVKEPGKPGWFGSQEGIYDLAAGAEVISNADLLRMFGYYSMRPAPVRGDGPTHSNEDVVAAIAGLTSVIRRKPEHQTNISWLGIMKQTRVGSSTITRMQSQKH